MASSLSIPETVVGQYQSWLNFTMLLNLVLEGNSKAHCRIMASFAPLISDLWNNCVILEFSKERLSVNGRIKYIRRKSIKIVQSFAVLIEIEDGIWASVYKYGWFVVGMHGNSELTGNINEFQNVGNVIWVVEKS